jgi:hypothetical protein
VAGCGDGFSSTQFHSPEYEAARRLGPGEDIAGAYVQLYREQQPFLRFLDELDAVILAEKPDGDSSKPYRRSILDFYDLFRAAHEKGVAGRQHPLRADARFLYRTVTDFLNGAAKKFLRGEVLPEDDYSQAARSWSCLWKWRWAICAAAKNKLGGRNA